MELIPGRICTAAGWIMLGLLVAATGGWGTLALTFSGPRRRDTIRLASVSIFAAVALGALIALGLRRWHWHALAAYFALFALVVVWWRSIQPSNDRDWQTDVAVLPYATIDGELVTIHNIRNFDYRSQTDYTPAYYDKRFDLRKLEGADLIAVYWMGPTIAHIFVSFAFAGGDHLAISIETRKEKGERYSTIEGFFRNYELYYVVADERDVIRLRTNFRLDPPEEVYVYPLQVSLGNARGVFLEYMAKINSLKVHPEFYNTLTTNCTTNIWFHTLVNRDHLPLSWKILASGHLPKYVYEAGRLDTRVPFAELERAAHINARAKAADGAADFSRLIREAPEMTSTP
jgi:hypothetical protein